MNVKELIEILKDKPDNMQVFVAERKTEFTYGLVNSAKVKKINLVDYPDGEVIARENVLLLDEE